MKTLTSDEKQALSDTYDEWRNSEDVHLLLGDHACSEYICFAAFEAVWNLLTKKTP